MKEFVTVLSLMSVGLWVVQAITLGLSGEFPPDPRFVGFQADDPITRQEIERYRNIYLNSRWEEELAKVGRARRTPAWQSSTVVVIPSRRH